MNQQVIGTAHQPLRVAVCNELRRRIIAGTLAQGERILEDQLAGDLQVSRNPIREALQTLAHEGFVELEPRRGARVMVLSDQRAGDVFAVRESLEALVASLAAQRRTPEQLAEMTALVDAAQTALATGGLSELAALNTRYHAVLTAAAGNELLDEMLPGLTHRIEWIYSRRIRERGAESWGEHAGIIDAIAAADPGRAAALAAAHIRNARDAYFAAPIAPAHSEPSDRATVDAQ